MRRPSSPMLAYHEGGLTVHQIPPLDLIIVGTMGKSSSWVCQTIVNRFSCLCNVALVSSLSLLQGAWIGAASYILLFVCIAFLFSPWYLAVLIAFQ
jgi:hypothetical protein